MLRNGVVFADLDYGELRAAAVGLTTVLLRPGLSMHGLDPVADAPLFTSFGGHSGHGLAVCSGVWSWRVSPPFLAPRPSTLVVAQLAVGRFTVHFSRSTRGGQVHGKDPQSPRPGVRNQWTGDGAERLVGAPLRPDSGTTTRETASRGTPVVRGSGAQLLLGQISRDQSRF